jgi:hypothetical protein
LRTEAEFFSSTFADGKKRLGRKDLSWKYKILNTVLNEYNEPFLNLHFLGPWFKDCQSSLGSLELIFELLWVLSPESKSALLEFLHSELKGMQKALFMNAGDDHG